MVDAVTSTTLYNNANEVAIRLTNISDGTGELSVLKVDASTFHTGDLSIQEIWFASCGMGFELDWDATTDVVAFVVGGNAAGSAAVGHFDFRSIGGIQNTAGAGKTGDILLTTIGQTLNDTYDITLRLKKM